jgi:hypothetical protein
VEPEQITDTEVKQILETLWISQEGVTERPTSFSPEIMSVAAQFVKELSYTALCTIWTFYCCESEFIRSLPLEVVEELNSDLFSLTMHLVLQQLV